MTIRRTTGRPVRLGALAALLLAFLSTTAGAQSAPGVPGAAPGERGAVVATRPAGAGTAQEQTIYIPYKKLRDVFEREGRGVFLPYEQFNELWRAAREREAAPVDAGPPVDALISEVDNEAVVARDVMQIKSRVKIEVLKEGWNRVPLRLGDAAITRATIGNEAARIVNDAGGYALLVEKPGKASKEMELTLEYAKAYSKAPGQNSVAFDAPRAPISKWRVRLPGAGVKVNIHPMLAATEAPGEGKADETVVMAFVGAAAQVRIDWTPRAEGATGVEAMATAEVEQQAWLEPGVIRSRARIAYQITRAQMAQLTLDLPADHKLVGVVDANVRQWSVAQADKAQRVTVQLFEPAKGSQAITVEMEKFLSDEARQEVTLPVVRAVGVARQQGVLAVYVADALRGEAIRRSGLVQVDVGELPASLGKGKVDFAYRYAALPYELTLNLEKVQPRVTADVLVEATMQPEQLLQNVSAVYQIERAGVFRLEMDLPAGYHVVQVAGRSGGGVTPVSVESHAREGADKGRLIINLSRKALGKVGVAVTLAKALNEKDLLTPSGKTVEAELAIPRVAPQSVERETGRLVVYAPESLRINPGASKGLRAVPIAEALAGIEGARGPNVPGGAARQALAFTYDVDPVALTLLAERRKPQVNVKQLLLVQLDQGSVTYTATFHYDILYSGVKTLRIDLPAALAGEIRNRTAGVRERVIEPAPADLAPGAVAWSLTGDSEFLGRRTLQFTWQKKLDKFEIGKPVDLALPHLKPREVDMAWGQIALVKPEAIDVQPAGEPVGVRPIDPQRDLMTEAGVTGAARAFEFQSDWTLAVTATRYKLEEVKRTSVEMAVVRMVLTRGGDTTVHAAYRMRSVRQALHLTMPKGAGFDTPTPLRLNGRPVALGRGDSAEQFIIPLAGQKPDEPFLLELRYTTPAGDTLLTPEFPEDPAAQRLHLIAYLPRERALLGSRGPWDDLIVWLPPALLAPFMDAPPLDSGSLWHWKPIAPVPDEALLQQVAQGIPGVVKATDDLRVDGRAYAFSSVRPQPGAAGALTLVTFDERAINLITLIAVLVLGVLLLPARPSWRWLTVGTLGATLVMLGIFAPTLSRQLINGITATAVALTALLWLIHHIVYVRPRDPVRQARREAALAEAAARTEGARRTYVGQPMPAAATPGAAAGAPPSSDPTNPPSSKE